MKKLWLLVWLLSGLARMGFAADGATALLECTFKIFNRSSTATCFLLHPDDAPTNVFLVTGGHVFAKMTNDEALLVLRVRGTNDTYSRKDYPLKVKLNNKPAWYQNPKEDIAVLRLPADLKQPFPSLPFACLADEKTLKKLDLHICSDVSIFGYPTRFEANDAGFPIGRHGCIASHPLTPVAKNKFFLVDFNTFEGDSGGPVFVINHGQPVILGMVLAQFRHDERIKTLDEERIIHTPLGISKVVHAVLIREAVQAAATNTFPSMGKGGH